MYNKNSILQVLCGLFFQCVRVRHWQSMVYLEHVRTSELTDVDRSDTTVSGDGVVSNAPSSLTYRRHMQPTKDTTLIQLVDPMQNHSMDQEDKKTPLTLLNLPQDAEIRKKNLEFQRRAEYAAHYGIERMRMYPWKWVEFIVNVLWVFILWLIFSTKVPTDGPWLYFHYFTNWMWTTNVIYYTVDLITYLDYSGTLQFYWLYCAWWPFFGNVCQVFWLVMPLLWMNPRIVVETAEEIGWSATLVGERLVHVLPLVRAWFYLWCRSRDIIDVLRHYWWENRRDRWYFSIYMLLMWLGGNLLIAAYCLNYDFHRVYGLDLNVGVAFVMIQVVFLLFLVLPILLMSPAGAVMRLYGFRHTEEMPLELHELELARTPPTVSDMKRRAKGGSGAHAPADLAWPSNVIFRPLPREAPEAKPMKYHWLMKRLTSWI